jgi:hypothetical protein
MLSLSSSLTSSLNKEAAQSIDGCIEPPIDPYHLLIEGSLETCTDEMIHLYLILILNPTLDDSFKLESMRRNRRRCLVKLNRKIQFDEISIRQNKVPELAGSSILISQFKTPNTIRVSNLASSCSKEMLNLYFSYAKVSGGGDIKSIKMFEYESKALIQFKDYNRVDAVLSQTHTICDHLCKLEKYYGSIENEYLLEEDEIDAQTEPFKVFFSIKYS